MFGASSENFSPSMLFEKRKLEKYLDYWAFIYRLETDITCHSVRLMLQYLYWFPLNKTTLFGKHKNLHIMEREMTRARHFTKMTSKTSNFMQIRHQKNVKTKGNWVTSSNIDYQHMKICFLAICYLHLIHSTI